jgi:hypothetical protein
MQDTECPNTAEHDGTATVIDAALSLATGKIYDLTDGQGNSGAFYSEVAAFADRVVLEAEFRAGPLLEEYGEFLRFATKEPARSRGEHALELLTLGMALRLYAAAAARTGDWAVVLAESLLRLRRRSQRLKPATDLVRGCLFRFGFATPAECRDPELLNLDRLPRLLRWMEATGEFHEEAARLRHWLDYLHTATTRASFVCLETAAWFFDWFTVEAAGALGKYTKGVRPFLGSAYLSRVIREDRFFCGRKPVEYHLGMVAAEVMNQALRPAFEQTRERVLLVPACMRGARAERCMALVQGLDILCTGCDPECNVNRIAHRMRDEGVRVFLVPHATGFSHWLERWQREQSVGVAAVACMLNILPGGYEMRRRGIPSQCVPLDHPGCRKHWCRQNLPTSVNQERLVRIVTGGVAAKPAA